jgi:hypothetical protein
MNNATVVLDPRADADLRNIVQTMVVNHDVAITGQTNSMRSLSFSGPRMAKYWAVCSEIFGPQPLNSRISLRNTRDDPL